MLPSLPEKVAFTDLLLSSIGRNVVVSVTATTLETVGVSFSISDRILPEEPPVPTAANSDEVGSYTFKRLSSVLSTIKSPASGSVSYTHLTLPTKA